jgi:hypothetical protein
LKYENQVVSRFYWQSLYGVRTVYSSIKLENEKTASPIAVFSVSVSTYPRKQPDFILLISTTNVAFKRNPWKANEQIRDFNEHLQLSHEYSL